MPHTQMVYHLLLLNRSIRRVFNEPGSPNGTLRLPDPPAQPPSRREQNARS